MEFKRILRSDQPLLRNPTKYLRMVLVPSSEAGKFRCLTANLSQVVSVLPEGAVILNPANGHDGGYEAAELSGTRLIYDYDEMTGDPVVFDVMVKA